MVDIILDIEATCWENANWREKGSEIIEIGAVICATGAAASFMIKPVKNPVLSEFCTKLTTITQSDVEHAGVYVDVLAEFVAWAEKSTGKPASEIKWGSWGFYDLNIIEANSATHGVPMPFSKANHTNVKLVSLEKLGMRNGGVGQALHKLNIKFEGTPHRGIDDAIMINKIYQIALKR